MKKKRRLIPLLALCLICACRSFEPTLEPLQPTEAIISLSLTPPTATPFLPQIIEGSATQLNLIHKPDFLKDLTIEWIDESLINEQEKSGAYNCEYNLEGNGVEVGNFVYALIAPFNSLKSSISIEELNKIFKTGLDLRDQTVKIYLSKSAYDQFQGKWGDLSSGGSITPEDAIIEIVSHESLALGIVRFDQLMPSVKVLSVEGTSPLDKDFQENEYILNIKAFLSCNSEEVSEIFFNNIKKKFTTRDSEKLTSVLLTGTTALTRATANRMEISGFTYPGEKIKQYFDNADLRHISSETSFFANCPPPNPYQTDLSFCSRPEYLDLFTYLNINVIELTGNHLMDKGYEPFINTLGLFNDLDIPYYAGGYSLEQAQQPLLFEHNGNKLAFLGCNLAGPPAVWANSTRGGVNACDFSKMTEEIESLSVSGYLPIVTFQYFESISMRPSNQQIRDFRTMVDAGAVIVSGSQSHVPMAFEFYQNSFIHYGLGNLFFDQMDSLNNRQEFLDRHIFYDGKYISTELITTMLEYYAQPRPMSPEEREDLLNNAFIFFNN